MGMSISRVPGEKNPIASIACMEKKQAIETSRQSL